SRATINDALGPDLASVTMYYALNRSQSNASSFKCIRLMQTLKHAKQFIHILHIKAHSVVPNEYYEVICVTICASDLDLGLRACAREFNRIGNTIHDDKLEHGPVSIEIGQLANLPVDVAPLRVLPGFGAGLVPKLPPATQRIL